MSLVDFIYSVILPMQCLAAFFALVRLIRGPSLPDRVVALDLIATLIIGIAAAYSVAAGHTAFLDVAVILALVAFLGTVAFSYYLSWRDPDV
jgi:multicomponent Na+:H+ antiporter subunit F